jgi:membrane associated rhomboid family serine protease
MLKKLPAFNFLVGLVTVLAYLWAHDFSFAVSTPQALINAGKLVLSTEEGRGIASRPYTLLTNFFVHTSSDHIFTNLAVLTVCGFFVELLSKRFWVCACIFIVAIPATATNLLVPGNYAGLSGYTMALGGAALAYMVRLGGEYLFPAPHRKAACAKRIAQWSLLLLVFAIYVIPEKNRAMTHVGNYAHIAGYLTGMIIGMLAPIKEWDAAPIKRWLACVLIVMAPLCFFGLY